MNRSVLIIIIIVLTLAIAAIGLVVFWQPEIFNGTANTNSTTNQANTNLPGTANTNTNTSTNTNETANANIAPSNVNVVYAYNAKTLDTATVGKRIQYRGADIAFSRVEIRDGITGLSPAPDGQKWVYVFLEREVLQQSPNPVFWVTQEATLRDDQNTVYTLTGLGLPNEQTLATEEGYLSFLVGQSSKGFVLRLVRTDEDVSVELGL